MKKILILLVLVATCGGGAFWYWYRSANPPVVLRTAVVERGELLATINATGTIEPEEVVDVGAQVAGMITSLGQDPRDSTKSIDFSSPVEKDTVLARIDDAIYRSQVDQAQAMVEQAEGQVAQAQAQVEQAEAGARRAEADSQQLQARLFQADRDWRRAEQLMRSKGALTDVDYDSAEAAFKTSTANLAVGEAGIAVAKGAMAEAKANVLKARAGLSDAKASLKRAETNLGYCTIKSPVKGVIIDRRINVGQTVVSSLNSPSLFLIAKDLRRLQVWASVNEADVGNVHSGQPVHFSVDAYPGEVFEGVVAPDQPRLNASMTQNVVSYTVVVNTDNVSGRLLPYQTANLEFEVSRKDNALLVPNAALRWRASGKESGRAKPASATGDATTNVKVASGKAKDRRERGTLWVSENGMVTSIPVVLGLNDGFRTEILEGALKEGKEVVVGEARKEVASGTSNPFTPQMFGGASKKPQ